VLSTQQVEKLAMKFGQLFTSITGYQNLDESITKIKMKK